MMRKASLILLSILLTVSVALPMAFASSAQAKESSIDKLTVVCPDQNQRRSGSNPDDPYGYAHVSEAIDMSRLLHDSDEKSGRDRAISSYSLLDEGEVTSVKNQNPYGTCWSFATMASAESGMLKKYGLRTDLSELQLAYFNFTNYQKADPLYMITGDGNSLSSNDYLFDMGGNVLYSTFSLASGIGFSRENDYPYSNVPSYLVNGTADDCYATSYRLRAARWLSMSEPEVIKQTIIDHGAVAASYRHDRNYYNWASNGDYCFYYDVDGMSTNHVVTLVGWDDNYPKSNFRSGHRPTSNGAWLVKNSWGTDWGNDGYFWISYEDKCLKDSFAAFFDAEPFDESEAYNLYQYDGSFSLMQYQNMGSTTYQANIYTSEAYSETLTDVGIFSETADIDYTIYVYLGLTDTTSPVSGTKVLQQSGHLDDAGYYLIPLNMDIDLLEGEKFSIVVRQHSDSESLNLYVDGSYDTDQTVNDEVITISRHNDATNDISFCGINGDTWYCCSDKGYSARIKALTRVDARSFVEIESISNGGTDSGVTINFTSAPGATAYRVERQNELIDNWDILTSNATGGSYTDSTADEMGELYFYRVRPFIHGKWMRPSAYQYVVRNPFTDIYYMTERFRYTALAYNNGIVGGTSKTTYSPEKSCTRAQFCIMLWKMYGKPEVAVPNKLPFSDISDQTINTKKAIIWCANQGIVSGKNGKFNPKGNIKRSQLAIMLYKAAGKPSFSISYDYDFTDISSETANTIKAIKWIGELAWRWDVSETELGFADSLYRPSANGLRHELTAMIYGYWYDQLCE